jgi:cobalt-precorrin 5A hydrolase/precorrin-3B C17-methyltransferase
VTLVVGVGTSTGAPPAEVADLVHETLAGAGLAPASVVAVATIASRADDLAIVTLGWPVTAFSPDELRAVVVPNPSAVAHTTTGTPSVAEAAALLAAGAGGQLIVAKRASAHATVAIARRGPR